MLAAYRVDDPQLPPSTDVPPLAVHSVISLYGPPDAAMLYRTTPSFDFVRAASFSGGAERGSAAWTANPLTADRMSSALWGALPA